MRIPGPRCSLCALAHVHDTGEVFCRREGRQTSPLTACLHFWPATHVGMVQLAESTRNRHMVIKAEQMQNRPIISGHVSQKCFTKSPGVLVTPGQSAMGGTHPPKTPVFKGANRWRSA